MPLAQRTLVPERPLLAALPDERHVLAQALGCGLELPVAALRASLEGLAAELRGLRPPPAAIPGVLEEVRRLGRNVESLIDLARPAEPRPLRCRVEEILRCAARAFLPCHRPRLVLVHPARDATLVVDGPLLSRLLERLIENALEASDREDVLLIARARGSRVEFCILNHAPAAFDVRWALQPFHSTKPNRLGLGLPLAERDARALGGRLTIETGSARDVRVRVRLPAVPPSDDGEELAA